MSYMFCGWYSLTSLDLSKFDTNNDTNRYGMFNKCSSFTILNLSNFNINIIIYMGNMFEGYCS